MATTGWKSCSAPKRIPKMERARSFASTIVGRSAGGSTWAAPQSSADGPIAGSTASLASTSTIMTGTARRRSSSSVPRQAGLALPDRLLDASGRSEGEYWNAGYIMDASAGDVDGDGTKELVLSGVNNEYRRGCVAIFEAGGLRGGSPQLEPAFRSPDIGAGGRSGLPPLPEYGRYRSLPPGRGPGQPLAELHEGDGLTAMTTDTQVLYEFSTGRWPAGTSPSAIRS